MAEENQFIEFAIVIFSAKTKQTNKKRKERKKQTFHVEFLFFYLFIFITNIFLFQSFIDTSVTICKVL